MGCEKQWEATAPIQSHCKTAALVPEFVLEDLPSTELQPRFLHLQEGTALGQNTRDDDIKLKYIGLY